MAILPANKAVPACPSYGVGWSLRLQVFCLSLLFVLVSLTATASLPAYQHKLTDTHDGLTGIHGSAVLVPGQEDKRASWRLLSGSPDVGDSDDALAASVIPLPAICSFPSPFCPVATLARLPGQLCHSPRAPPQSS